MRKKNLPAVQRWRGKKEKRKKKWQKLTTCLAYKLFLLTPKRKKKNERIGKRERTSTIKLKRGKREKKETGRAPALKISIPKILLPAREEGVPTTGAPTGQKKKQGKKRTTASANVVVVQQKKVKTRVTGGTFFTTSGGIRPTVDEGRGGGGRKKGSALSRPV